MAPCIDYALSAELENDWVFAATPPSLRSNDLYPTLESAIILAPLSHVRLIGDFIFEPVKDPPPGRSTAFADLGAYVDQLYLEVEYGAFNLQAGKIHPSFGQAWDVAPGLHATDIPGNYELEERIGIGAAYEFDALGFDNVLQASLFTTYDRADERLLVEHALPLFLKLGHEPGGEGAERQYFLIELDRRLRQ